VKKTIVTLACALIAPLAFAQTSTTTTEQTTTATQPTTTTETTTTYTAGTVTTYEPSKTIVVKSDSQLRSWHGRANRERRRECRHISAQTGSACARLLHRHG